MLVDDIIFHGFFEPFGLIKRWISGTDVRHMNKTLICCFYLSLIVVVFIGCSEDPPEINVDPVFQVFVDEFIEEAARFGQDIDFSDTGLSIQFRDAVDRGSSGVCLGNHRIEIETAFWGGLTDFDKQGLIFHELGHCELDRPHRNDKLANGEWASRMRGDPIPEECNAVINYAGTRLEYYISEFFLDRTAPLPDWQNRTAEFTEQFDRITELNLQNIVEFEEFVPGISSGDFEIEVVINANNSQGFVGIQFMGASDNSRVRIGYNDEGTFAIDSGDLIWGLMYLEENFDLIEDGNNRITVRRQGDFYFVFLNETFVYWFDYFRPSRESVSSLNAATRGAPEYESITVQRLN